MIMTLVFTLAAAGNLSSYFYVDNKRLFKYSYLNSKNNLRYHFNYIPFAFGFLNIYNLAIPTIIYFLLKSIESKVN